MEQYCPQCGEKQEVVKTVTWQANVCQSCGNEVEPIEN